MPLNERLVLVYNKFSNKNGKTLSDLDIRDIGGAPRMEHAGVEEVLKLLARTVDFDKISE